MIVKDSKEEKIFVNKVIKAIKDIVMSDLSNVISPENIVCSFTCSLKEIWRKNSKIISITKHSKSWWNTNCNRDLEKYRSFKCIKNWKQFKKTVKYTKYSFFNFKIQEISNKKWGPWELMNWVNKCKLPAVEAVKYNSHPYLKIENLWHALYSSFNMAQN